MAWSDLESRTDRALKALPAPEAPSTLVSNVMRAVAAASETRTPWYSRAWLNWPLEAKLASLAMIVIAGSALWREGPIAWMWVTNAFATIHAPAWLTASLDVANRALLIGRLPWHFFQNVLWYFALLALVASIAMIASWHAFTRLVSEGASAR